MPDPFELGDPFFTGTYAVSLEFTRATREQASGAGELTLSFAALGAFAGELYPQRGVFARGLAGTVDEVNYNFFLTGNHDLRAGDRVTISGALLEVINTRHFGVDFSQVDLKFLR